MNLEFIFKVIDKYEWQKAKQSGTYGGSEKDLKDGYIHFSEEDQVEETLNKHYPKKENLVLIPFLLEGVALNPSLNQQDGIHPNEEGTIIISKTLKEIILKNL